MDIFHPHDYEILQQIFFPTEKKQGELILFCTGNDCSQDVDLNEVSGVIGLGETKALTGFDSREFYFINNPDGSIRWLIPVECRRPIFLNLYNGSGWRGKIFRLFFQMTFGLGLKSFAVSGKLRVFYQRAALFDGLFKGFDVSNMAIFTGTVGENRKAVFSLKKERKSEWFFKMPMTEKAEKLVNRESAALSELKDLDFQNLEIPEVAKRENGVLISNVRPRLTKSSVSLHSKHLSALNELSQKTRLTMPVSSLAVWAEIKKSLESLNKVEPENGIKKEKVEKMQRDLSWILSTFEEKDTLPTTVTHGDFTPWNLFLSPDKVHLYDWELSARRPLLFDAFHFIFQAGVLVERLEYTSLKLRVEQLRKEIIGHEKLEVSDSEFNRLYHFYLLSNVSYYLSLYVKQDPIHEQAFWLIDVWEKALSEVVKSLPSEPKAPSLEKELQNIVSKSV